MYIFKNYNLEELGIVVNSSSVATSTEGYNINLQCTYIKKNYSIREIIRMLKGAGKLMFEGERDKYCNATASSISYTEKVKDEIYELAFSFQCDPYWYFYEGENIINITNGMTLINDNEIYSEPLIKIYGTGDITFAINNQGLELKAIAECIELDSSIQECYYQGSNLNSKMIGDFPILEVGENKIGWNGEVAKVEILPRWRCL